MKRFLAFALSLVMVLSMLPVEALAVTKTDTSGKSFDIDDAMHFYFRHWHTYSSDVLEEESSQGAGQESGGTGLASATSIVIDGYIKEKTTGGYSVYMRLLENGDEDKNVPFTELDFANLPEDFSPYIDTAKCDVNNGVLVLKTNPIQRNETSVEEFTGFSISAGHDAVETYINRDEEIASGTITITYSKNVHLVKGHVFYVSTLKKVLGENFISGKGMKSERSPEVETLSAADTDDGKKHYLNTEGLHTDKTASESTTYTDGRTFDLELEAWYSEGTPFDVAMVLDASGSMGFAAGNLGGDPKYKININSVTNLTQAEKNSLPRVQPNDPDIASKFLSPDIVNKILNPRMTDASRLGASGYSYFIYDPRDTTVEYVPIGYWDGATGLQQNALIGKYTFNKGANSGTAPRDWLKNEITNTDAQRVERIAPPQTGDTVNFNPFTMGNWTGKIGDDGLKMDNNIGFNLTKSTHGILLDAVPTSGKFTISFTLTTDGTDPSDNAQKLLAEILYIGSVDPTKPVGNYYRGVRREGSSSARFAGYNSDSNNDIVSNVNNVFNTTSSHIITLVYDGTKFITYYDGQVADAPENAVTNPNAGTELPLDGFRFVLHGINDDYSTGAEPAPRYNAKNIYIDEFYVYDAALTANEVNALYQTVTNNSSVANQGIAYNNTGAFVGTYDTARYQDANGNGKAGWYYINYLSRWKNKYVNPLVQSTKTLYGMPPADNNGSLIYTDTDLNVSYTQGDNSPIRFYLDNNGYLKCFFAGSEASNPAYSFVYAIEDEDYIKVEALQRALGSFVTALHASSPESLISAVRFSMEYDDKESQDRFPLDYEKLVLLDWTNDPLESTGVLSLERGVGGTIDGTPSQYGINQYNYGLTGGTSTWTGLKALIDVLLKDSNYPNDSPGKKEGRDRYVIIFTDGLDTDISSDLMVVPEGKTRKELAKSLADTLKRDYGFTIYTVMLAGGAVNPNNGPSAAARYDQASNFLKSLSGKTADNSEDKSPYFLSTANYGSSSGGGLVPSTQEIVDNLQSLFTQRILGDMIKPLEDYTVKDYIDPRFDLIDASGVLWHLNAGGNIQKVDALTKEPAGTANANVPTGVSFEVSRDKDTTTNARKARLHYDGEHDMYYLEWTDQTIPISPKGVEKLTIWNARVTIRAKEDFIGGNAVLTNGHLEKMNWVYYPEDAKEKPVNPGDRKKGVGYNASSGTDDMYRVKDDENTPDVDETDNYPSKGFPRVTVNVKMPVPKDLNEVTIYMGEPIFSFSFSEVLAQATPETAWYWEYLLRYDAYSPENVFEELFYGEKHAVKMPYYYLPNTAGANGTPTNQTGIVQRGDPLGWMTYTMTPLPEYTAGTPTRDTTRRETTLTVEYEPFADPSDTSTTGTDRAASGANAASGAAARANTVDAKVYEGDHLTEDEDRERLLNDRLIDEKRKTGDTDPLTEAKDYYAWFPLYKKAAGNKMDPEDGKKELIVNIVSGEVHLQVKLTREDVAFLQESFPGGTLTYKADLARTYGNGIVNEVIGTYTATYNIPGSLPSGDVIIDAELVYNSNYGKYSDSEIYALPIGTYEVIPNKSSNTALYTFTSPAPVVLSASHVSRFERFGNQIGETNASGQRDPGKLPAMAAPYDTGNRPYLGTGTALDRSRVYTDERYALLEVTIQHAADAVPQTGDNSNIQMWIALMVVAIGTMIAFHPRRKAAKGRR